MSDEKPYIQPGTKLRVLNESGRGRATRFFDAESGAEFSPSGVCFPIAIRIDGDTVKADLTMYRVPVDLVGTVVGMKMTDKTHCIEFDPAKYDVVVKDTKDGMKRVYFERKD